MFRTKPSRDLASTSLPVCSSINVLLRCVMMLLVQQSLEVSLAYVLLTLPVLHDFPSSHPVIQSSSHRPVISFPFPAGKGSCLAHSLPHTPGRVLTPLSHISSLTPSLTSSLHSSLTPSLTWSPACSPTLPYIQLATNPIIHPHKLGCLTSQTCVFKHPAVDLFVAQNN